MENNMPNIEHISAENAAPLYTSAVCMDEKNYAEFSAAGFKKMKQLFIGLFAVMLLVCLQAFVLPQNIHDCVIVSFAVSLAMYILYFRSVSLMKKAYRRDFFANGNMNVTLHTELYPHCIMSINANGAKRDFQYGLIKDIAESKSLILLLMQYDLAVVIDKRTLNAPANEVRAFLLSACPNLKKKKVFRFDDDKKICIAVMIAAAAITAALLVFAAVYAFTHIEFTAR